MHPLKRLILYHLQIIPIARSISNWYLVPLFPLKLINSPTMKLRSGAEFKVSHLLDVLTIQEIYVENQYHIPLKNPKVIIDVGANIGTFSILMALRYPNTKILAYEPCPSTFKLLAHNTKINNIKSITAFCLGVAATKGKINFFVSKASGLGSLFPTGRFFKKTSIHTDTLNNIFIQHDIKKCDLLKLDCEGAEYEIFFSIPPSLLKKIDNIVLEYHDHLTKHNHHQLIKFLRSQGYSVRVVPHPLETCIGILYARR